jgi:hypothetical protein
LLLLSLTVQTAYPERLTRLFMREHLILQLGGFFRNDVSGKKVWELPGLVLGHLARS